VSADRRPGGAEKAALRVAHKKGSDAPVPARPEADAPHEATAA